MRVDLALERSVLKPYKYYLVINDRFVWRINKKLFYSLADSLEIKID